MGEITLPACDIYKTVQREGLRSVRVEVIDIADDDPTSDSGKRVLFECDLDVGNVGFDRVLRMIKAAVQPPKQ